MSYHNITIVGNCGSDPTMRYTQDGNAVTTMSIATNKVYTNKAGEKVKKVVWFRVSVWGKMAENVNNFLHKGSLVLVEGEINAGDDGNPKLFDRNDGSKGASYEVMAKNVQFLSSNKNESSEEEDPWAG